MEGLELFPCVKIFVHFPQLSLSRRIVFSTLLFDFMRFISTSFNRRLRNPLFIQFAFKTIRVSNKTIQSLQLIYLDAFFPFWCFHVASGFLRKLCGSPRAHLGTFQNTQLGSIQPLYRALLDSYPPSNLRITLD